MAKHKLSKTQSSPKKGSKHKEAVVGKFVDRNLYSINPNKEQFEPTDAMPVRQHYKMAGGA